MVTLSDRTHHNIAPGDTWGRHGDLKRMCLNRDWPQPVHALLATCKPLDECSILHEALFKQVE